LHLRQDQLQLPPWRSVSAPRRHLSLLSRGLYSCIYLNIEILLGSGVDMYTWEASVSNGWSTGGRAEEGCCMATYAPDALGGPGCLPRELLAGCC